MRCKEERLKMFCLKKTIDRVKKGSDLWLICSVLLDETPAGSLCVCSLFTLLFVCLFVSGPDGEVMGRHQRRSSGRSPEHRQRSAHEGLLDRQHHQTGR